MLVSEAGVAKLADFGCSKQLQGMRTTSLDQSLKVIRGSVPWMAPEGRSTKYICDKSTLSLLLHPFDTYILTTK